MKIFYLSLIIVTLLLLIVNSAITVAIPQEFYVAMTLEQYPDTWELRVKNDARKRLEAIHVKEELLQFIACKRRQYLKSDEIVLSGCIVLLFSGIGYYRERRHDAKPRS